MKVTIDIWSDILCPFCYIGKRRLETALSQFKHHDQVEIIWHSFQLDPHAVPHPQKNVYHYLAERKGQSLEWSIEAHEHVKQMAADAGLVYNFDKAVVANSFDAHRLIHLAQKKGKGNEAEEVIFKAYFTEGKNISDRNELIAIGKEIGLNEEDIQDMFSQNLYGDEVKQDMFHAQQLGIRGVPFFVFNEKYGISGAQYSQTFLDVLNKVWEEKSSEVSPDKDQSCNVEGC